MKSKSSFFGLLAVLVFLAFFCLQAEGQDYSINWHKISGGGGTSTNGQYSLSGTIGQHDAGGPMTDGTYSLYGGFWSMFSVIQTPGAPNLFISHSGNQVTIYWQNVAGWNLVQNDDLTIPPASWSPSSSPTLTNGTNYLSITNPIGNQFFRLKH